MSTIRWMRWSLLALLVATTLWAPTGRPTPAAGADGAAPGGPETAQMHPERNATAATEVWDRVLSRAHHDGGLDYAALTADRKALDAYLASLEGVRPETVDEETQLAFWVNAYNAVVVHHVLERYPGLESVRDVDGFFDELTFPVAGEARTLDEIETEARELDVRSHFAVVCASTSCPDLRGEAYVGSRIDAQLDEQTRSFLSDPSKGLRYDAENNDLYLSSIFKWYADDFTGGSRIVAFFARGGVREWVAEHAPKQTARLIESREPSVKYMDYDWSLNDRPRGR